MSVANIEVRPEAGGWRWHILGDCGRDLVRSPSTFPCDLVAFNAAKDWRAEFVGAAHHRDRAE